jgi:hypothetical protein
MTTTHPYTMFNETMLGKLQSARTTSHKNLADNVLEPILERYKAAQTLQSQSNHSDARNQYEGIGGYAIAARIFCGNPNDPNCLTHPNYKQYLEVAKRSILAMKFRSDCDDLQQARFVRNLALGYDVLHPMLSDGERVSCRQELIAATKDLKEKTNRGYSTDLLGNHNWVDYSAIGVSGFTLQFDPPPDPPSPGNLPVDWINLAVNNAEKIKKVQNLIVDGSWHEGIGYLEFGLSGCLLLWLAARMNGSPGHDTLDDTALMKALGRYILSVQAPGNPRLHVLTHGDWNWSRLALVATLQYIASRFDDRYAQTAVQRWMDERDRVPATRRSTAYEEALYAVLQYITYNPALIPFDLTSDSCERSPVSCDYFATDQQAAILRSGWDDNSVVLVLKCGVLGGRGNYNRIKVDNEGSNPNPDPGGFLNIGHDHIDDLGIWLYGKGGWYLPEVAGYNCCCTPIADPQNPGAKKPDDRQYTTRYHNSFLINGRGQLGDERNGILNSSGEVEHNATKHPWFFVREAGMPTFASTAHYSFAAGDGSKLYPQEAQVESVLRTVAMSRDGYCVLYDRVRLRSVVSVEQLLHFQQSASREEKDGVVWLKGVNENDHILGVAIVSSSVVSWPPESQSSNSCYSLYSPCNQEPYDTGCRTDRYMAHFTLAKVRPTTNSRDVTFLEVLWPTKEAHWSGNPAVKPLSSSVRELGFELPLGTVKESWVYSKDGTAQTDTLRLSGGQIGIVRSDNAGTFQRLVLLGKGVLSDQSRTLLETPSAGIVEVVLSGRRADLSGTLVNGVRFFGPEVDEVWTNNQKVAHRKEGPMVIVGSNGGGGGDPPRNCQKELKGCYAKCHIDCKDPDEPDPAGCEEACRAGCYQDYIECKNPNDTMYRLALHVSYRALRFAQKVSSLFHR